MRLVDLIHNIRSFFKNLFHKSKNFESSTNVGRTADFENSVPPTVEHNDFENSVPPTVEHNDYEILYSLVLEELKKKYASKEIGGVLYFYDNQGICAYDDNGILSLYLDINSSVLWHHGAIMFTIINDIKTDAEPLDAIHIMPMMGALESVGVVNGKYTPKHFPYEAYKKLSKNFHGKHDSEISTCGKLFLDEEGHFNACLLDQFLLKNNISIEYVRNPKGSEYLKNLEAYRKLLSRESDFRTFSLDMHCDSSEYTDGLFHFLSNLFDKKDYFLGGLELDRQPVSEDYTYVNGLRYVQSDSNSLYISVSAELKRRYNGVNIDGVITYKDDDGRVCARETDRNIKLYLKAKSNRASFTYEVSITDGMELDDTISDTVTVTQVNESEIIKTSGFMYRGSMRGSLCAELFGSMIIDNISPSKGEDPVINVLSVSANITNSTSSEPTNTAHDAQMLMAYPADLFEDKKGHRK